LALEQVDEILGGDVAGCARCEGAAADAADGPVEHSRARLDRCPGGCDRGVTRVVEMDADREAVSQRPVDQRTRLPRDGDAYRVREEDLVGPGGCRPGGQLEDAAWVDLALERAAEGGADGDRRAAPAFVRACDHLGGAPEPGRDGRSGVSLLERL